MTLNQLQYFQTVARYENYHQAAAELYISQPSLSKSIAALEKELGTVLFEKVGRGICLTKSGVLFLEYVNRILSGCEAAVYKMQELSSGGGRIDIGYVFPLAERFIPRMVKDFLAGEQDRSVTFSFSQDVTSAIMAQVKKGCLDAGFCAYAENEEELECLPVQRQEMVLIVPEDHPLSGRREASVLELGRYPVIGYHRSSMLSSFTRRACQGLGIQPEIVCECPDEHAISAMVREGFGIALLAGTGVAEGDGIRVLRLSDASLHYWIYMVWRKDRYLIPAAQRFLRFMKERTEFPARPSGAD